LTHPRFLELYKKVLIKGGKIHLKTDSPDLYNFTKLVATLCSISLISDIRDLYSEKVRVPELNINTHYERLDIANSKTVFYLSFSLPDVIQYNAKELTKLLKVENQNAE
jgi:tRNA (guanine-N7-)-methyltransferase